MTFLQNLFIVLLYFWWIIRSALVAPVIIGKVLWDRWFNKGVTNGEEK
jgi:hypothetical protein